MSQNTVNGAPMAPHGARHHENMHHQQSDNNTAPSSDWMARESLRQRELEETKARAAQMEKTMKWWSDCTANWREKWIKVRNERNLARDEAKQLRVNLEAAVKESSAYKRDKNDLEVQIGQLKKEMEKVHHMHTKHAGQFDANAEAGSEEGKAGEISPDLSSSDGLKRSGESHRDAANREDGLGSVENRLGDIDLNKDQRVEERRLIQQLSKDNYEDAVDAGGEGSGSASRSTSLMQMRLEDLQRTLQMERDEKSLVARNLERVVRDLQEAKDKCDELRASKQDAVRELLTIQEQNRAELRISGNALQEEIHAREALERRLCELRGELERMQSENAVEWEKRERLETEKLALERDNKKVRGEIRELQDLLDRRGRAGPVAGGGINGSNGLVGDSDVRLLQQELLDKNKEISDIKHSHNKMKKLLAEANTELGHAVRRAEQYETEVKRLRGRVEELKRELAGAEDELDAACNQVRRLRRTNEELDPDSARQRLSAPINLVTEKEWKNKFRPNMQNAAEEEGDADADEDEDDDDISEGEYHVEENNRHKYSL